MELGKEILYLSKNDVTNIGIKMETIIDLMEKLFFEKSKRLIQMPPKIALHPGSGENFIHAMPAWIPSMETAGLKWVSGYGTNQKKGLPYINGLMILTDPETGIPYAIMDGVWITAERTGAMTGLTAKYLSNEDAKTIGILGCGVQGRTNLRALLVVRPKVEKVYVFDYFPDIAKEYAKRMSEVYEQEFIVCDRIEDVARNSDILVSGTPATEDPLLGIIEKSWLREGALITPIDGSVLFRPETLAQITTRFTDDAEQWLYFKDLGFWFSQVKETPLELCDLIAGTVHGRNSHDQQILVMNIGLAIEDVAVAQALYEKAVGSNIGTVLSL